MASLRQTFGGTGHLTVGVEEELMLLDPATLDLAPVAAEVVGAAGADGRVKSELPAAQLEAITTPVATVAEVVAQLAEGRRRVARACAGTALPAALAVHPFTGPLGQVSHERTRRDLVVELGEVARLQLVSGLHVHVRVTGAERALAVYNALRSYLPEIAALAASAPFVAGRDTGMASVRPKISELLPRQGVPPALTTWDEYAHAIAWGTRSQAFGHPRLWWWELRPHPGFGTIELRVPDQQATAGDSAAIAAVAHSLAGWLAARHDAGESLPVQPTWRIEENRWSAARHGLAGTMADLDSGERRPTRERLDDLLDRLEPSADELGCERQLERARALVRRNGSERMRAAAHGDPRCATASVAERFLEGT
ncbi:MAG: YbdK family carboxylate-amine ligase [Thermoleophilaceae bacterium]